MNKFNSVLVANRGEIAVRILRAAQEQGYRAIAVYSEADAEALHVQVADAAVLIGAAAVKESYLDMHKILQAAKQTGAQAIHPGYGFLSENAEFAKACEQAGNVFIGPSAHAIDAMGNKAAAKRLMIAAEVPCVPGYEGEDQSDEKLLIAAESIGFPLMVKAAAGGGGRGMRLVQSFDHLADAIQSARSEALNAFGSDELILEKAIINPRHVEVQVFGDSHGNVIHFGERDCSVQRRHQKVIEEAPCPVMTPELREAMGAAAVNAAKSIDYVGAGTVEFLLDADKHFYFLEMNTRLQVEHPVTELVTGYDLAALQFVVAQGEPLPVMQEDVHLYGHAIEARLYAEQPANDFLPATGSALLWDPPSGPGIRVDHGLNQGQEISPFYDPMLAKIIAYGEDRAAAIRRLHHALENTRLFGVENNREFLMQVLERDDFVQARATTAFIANNFTHEDFASKNASQTHILLAACLLYRKAQSEHRAKAIANANEAFGWRNNRPVDVDYEFALADESSVVVSLRETAPEHYSVSIDSVVHPIDLYDNGHKVHYHMDNVQGNAVFSFTGKGEVTVQIDGVCHTLVNQRAFTKGDVDSAGSGSVTAPMHGNVLSVSVNVGDQVEVGQTLAILEAMKMEHRIIAEVAGEVSSVIAVAGNQVSAGSLLMEIEEQE
ncbi:MAG: acetyl-CoA carboxylase biotin carboxylase subunit [Gammaproteobacteria bacterium]|nr:acetyl-CoA carboxylase biotin carboxylase subunit [Gammaproteobacteria bacterium]